MRPADDLFGEALYDAWMGRERRRLGIRRDDGHCDLAGAGQWLGDWLWPSEQVIAGAARGSVLDIGCGGGRHLVHFAARGHPVTGLDRSPGALRVCRARGLDRLIEADVLASGDLGRHDTILLFGNNTGIAGTPDGVRGLFARLGAALAPGGAVLLTSVDVRGATHGLHAAYRAANLRAGRPAGSQRLRLEYAFRAGPWFRWLHLTHGELRRYAAAAGLRVAQLVPTGRGGSYGAMLCRA